MPRDQIILLSLFILILLLIILFLRKKSPLKYKRVKNIFTPAEKKFYHALKSAVGEHFFIFAKVRAADVLLPVSAKDRSRWRSAFNKVACKHFDYVLCDENLRIVAAIELDDASHSRKDRKDRDDFIDWACKSAGFLLLRITPKKEYNPSDIKAQILKAVGRKSGRVQIE